MNKKPNQLLRSKCKKLLKLKQKNSLCQKQLLLLKLKDKLKLKSSNRLRSLLRHRLKLKFNKKLVSHLRRQQFQTPLMLTKPQPLQPPLMNYSQMSAK